MSKRLTALFLAAMLVLSVCSFASAKAASAPDALSTVNYGALKLPAVISADGTITAKFCVKTIQDKPGASIPATASTDVQIEFLPAAGLTDMRGESDLYLFNGRYDLTVSTFTVTGKLPAKVSVGDTLMYLKVTDGSSVDTVALPLSDKEDIKFVYSFSPDTLKKAYLYYDSAKARASDFIDNFLNKKDILNPEPDFFQKASSSYTWSKHYLSNSRDLLDEDKWFLGDHKQHVELYFAAELADSKLVARLLNRLIPSARALMQFDPFQPGNDENVHAKYPTDYILRDVSQAPLMVPNEADKPLLTLPEKSNDTIRHEPASIYNNPADQTIKFEWTLKGDDGSSLSAQSDQPALAPAAVSGIQKNVVYTVTCNAVLTDAAGQKVDSLPYAGTHQVKIADASKPVPVPVPTPTPEPPPKTGDTTPIGWLFLIAVLVPAVLVVVFAIKRKTCNNK